MRVFFSFLGSALEKCLVCRGNSGFYCKEGQTGESENCGREVRNRVCFEMQSKDEPDEQYIIRAGCVDLESAKNMAKKFEVVLNEKNQCNSVEERGEIIEACTCNTDDCNSKYKWEKKEKKQRLIDKMRDWFKI